jgi:hypothetical protein
VETGFRWAAARFSTGRPSLPKLTSLGKPSEIVWSGLPTLRSVLNHEDIVRQIVTVRVVFEVKIEWISIESSQYNVYCVCIVSARFQILDPAG